VIVTSAWSPSRLPKIRDGLHRLLSDPASALRRAYSGDETELEHVARTIAVADLFWIAPEMAALAVSSAATVPWVRWTVTDRPAPFGLLVFDGGVGTVDFQDFEVPVDAVAWGPDPRGLALSLFMRRQRLVDRLPDGTSLVPGEVPPLIPVGAVALDAGEERKPVSDLPDSLTTLLTTVFTAWYLMQQRTLADRSLVDVDRQIARAYRRASRPVPDVTLVALRRQYVPAVTGRDETGTDAGGSRYWHRWVVGGHWRDQPWGPQRSLRRLQWIPDYVKGPEGAPMLETTRVNVWRR
jgi:hypothetical protein